MRCFFCSAGYEAWPTGGLVPPERICPQHADDVRWYGARRALRDLLRVASGEALVFHPDGGVSFAARPA